jgi:hypothetical protein
MVAMVFPPVGNPMLTRMRRTVPVASGPDVMIAFIAMIPVDPHITPVRRWRTTLNNRRRWPDTNHDLRIRSHREHGESKQYCKCNLLHGESIPPVFEGLRNVSFRPAEVFNGSSGK